jgi:hypothetical protein
MFDSGNLIKSRYSNYQKLNMCDQAKNLSEVNHTHNDDSELPFCTTKWANLTSSCGNSDIQVSQERFPNCFRHLGKSHGSKSLKCEVKKQYKKWNLYKTNSKFQVFFPLVFQCDQWMAEKMKKN